MKNSINQINGRSKSLNNRSKYAFEPFTPFWVFKSFINQTIDKYSFVNSSKCASELSAVLVKFQKFLKSDNWYMHGRLKVIKMR